MQDRFFFSKSKYCGLWQCPKIAWLRKYRPEEMVLDDALRARMETGNAVGDLAMGLFGPFTEVTAYDGDRLDLAQMKAATQRELARGTPVICEASFAYDGLYCAVDILRRQGDGWAIYEVKSGTHDDKEVYYADIAYQKYVLEHCGMHVTGTRLVCLNREYVFDGTLDLQSLFRIVDVSREVAAEQTLVESNIALAQQLLSSDQEPDLDLSMRCRDPYLCAFWEYCARDLPKPSVFDLYRLPFRKKVEYYRSGQADFPSLLQSRAIRNPTQLRQIRYALTDLGDYTDPDRIRSFLTKLSYPLYFLDFETVQPAVPRYIGTRPYDQIPFQYSLHYIEREGGDLLHREFLAEAGTDPRRALAEQLCADIPMGVCVTAYNKAFECTRLRELAELFPDLAEHLLDIRDHIVDLLTPFQSGWYYNRAMGGSFSIKSVLPALFPDDPTLDYHSLEDIHNGSEAMNAFPAMEQMTPEARARTRENLLRYCELDTFAMVKVWEKLRQAAELP